MFRMSVLNATYQTLQGGLVGNQIAGFDLNNESGSVEAETALSRNYVDTLIRSRGRDLGLKSLGAQDRSDQPGEVMT